MHIKQNDKYIKASLVLPLSEEFKMNKDNLAELSLLIAVVFLIAGFAMHFNSSDLNKSVLAQGEVGTPKPFSAIQVAQEGKENGTTTTNGQIKNVQFSIDKSQFKRAPELAKISGYINTVPIKLSDLRGKVVLVDFWTYSCINWIRTLPYLNEWNEKYADKGLVIFSVHTPEFEFEKNIGNVMGRS